MQIVIDIPDNWEKELNQSKITFADVVDIDTIRNGTPLPKGHGKLIDSDALWDAYHDNDYDFYEALADAPTIIEADKESEE